MTKGTSETRSYIDAEAMREQYTKPLIASALELKAPNYALRVLLVMVHSVAIHNRVTDNITRAYMARMTGMDERQVSRGARWLAENELVMWSPGSSPLSGARRPSRVTFIHRPDRGTSDPRSDKSPVTPRPPRTGAPQTPDRGASDTGPGGRGVPYPGFLQESPRGASQRTAPEGGGDAAAPDVAPYAEALRDALLIACVEGTDRAEEAERVATADLLAEIEAAVDYFTRIAPDQLLDLAILVDDCMPKGMPPSYLAEIVRNIDDEEAISPVRKAIMDDPEAYFEAFPS